MSKFNPTNYATVSPAPDDVVLLWQKDTNSVKSATVASLGSQLQLAETIDALKAISTADLADGSTALVNGYYAAGDGGGGSFYYDQTSGATDNGGTVIAPDSGTGRWLRIFDGAINVRWFGATGDGTTDDSDAVDAAVAFCLSSTRCLYIPAGTYLVSSSNGGGAINITTSVKIYGDGAKSILKLKTGSTGMVIYAANNVTPIVDFTLRDFVVDGNSVATAQLDAGLIQLAGVQHFLIDNLHVKNGTRASAPAGINGIAIANSGVGITSGTVSNCLVENCSKALINWTTNGKDCLIIGNVCRGGTGNGLTPGIQVNEGFNGKIIGNECYQNQGSGILVSTSDYTIIANNNIYSNGQGSSEGYGIRVSSVGATDRLIITGNHIHENGVNVNSQGIIVTDGNDILITDNYIYKNSFGAISLGGSTNTVTNVVISNNIFEDNNTANNSSVGIINAQGTISNVNINNNRFLDTNGTSKMHYPIYTPAGTYSGWLIFGNEIINQKNFQAMLFDTSTPAVWTNANISFTYSVQTTDAANNNLVIAPVKDPSFAMLRATAMGIQSGGTNRAYYDKERGFYRSGGNVTALGAMVVYFEQESDATWGGVTPDLDTTIVKCPVAGKAATTINWQVSYNLRIR